VGKKVLRCPYGVFVEGEVEGVFLSAENMGKGTKQNLTENKRERCSIAYYHYIMTNNHVIYNGN